MDKVIVFGPGLSNTLGMVRSLGEKGLCVHVIMVSYGHKKNYIGRSKYIKKLHYLDSAEEVITVLHNNYWNEPERVAILCGGDGEISILDQHYDELHQRFLVFNCGEQGRLNFYLDKINQFQIAERSGLSLIKTWELDNILDLPKDIIFPCLTKGANSTKSTKGDMHICNSYDELRNCINDHTQYLVQEYIEKEYELNFVCMSYNHGQNVLVPCVIRKIRDDIGRQSAYFKTDTLSNYPNFDKKIISNIASQLRYEGIFSVEVVYSKGKYYFLEINMRNDGCGYLYTKAGCNYPYLWHKYAKGQILLKDLEDIKVKVPCTMMGENDLYNLFQRKVNMFSWIKQFLCSNAHYVLSFKDPLPYFFRILTFFQNRYKRILNLK